MDRKNFIKSLTIGSGALALGLRSGHSMAYPEFSRQKTNATGKELHSDLIIAGGGLGGCSAALAALRNGLHVIMTEQTNWIGGQLTQQGVSCPDEHQWIEHFGATQSYRDLRTAIRDYYKRYYPLTEATRSKKYLDPGNGAVSRICFEPRVALAVLYDLLIPYLSSEKLILLLKHKPVSADVNNDKVRSLKIKDLRSGNESFLTAPYFIDATELGDLLPMTGTEYIIGAESKKQTHELHATDVANPDNQQAFTHCFAMDYVEGNDHIIDKPKDYHFWKNYVPQLMPPWPGKLLSLKYSDPGTLKPKALGFNPTGEPTEGHLNLWNYRRIIDPDNFKSGFYKGGITIVNWPQNDFLLGNLVEVNKKEYEKTIEQSEQLGLSLFYWLQTEAPRPDGGQGWPGLRLRGDVLGTKNGLAKFPYVRESRRIKAVFTVLEEHVGAENRVMVAGEKKGKHAAWFDDSVGVGSYHIDLHPSSSGSNYIDFNSLPFQIPLGSLLPQRMKNLIPACKNIGTTHITNGCYRLHPVEWNIGESAGLIIAYALKMRRTPHGIRANKSVLTGFQQWIRAQGVETQWPYDKME